MAFAVAPTVLAAGLVLGIVTPANADVSYPMGTISGVVTPEGALVTPDQFSISFDIEAGTYASDPDFEFEHPATAEPGLDGSYSVSLRAGRYVAYVRPVTNEAKADYPPSYYPGVSTNYLASWVTVVEGENTILNLGPKIGGFFSTDIHFEGTVTQPTMSWTLVDPTASFPLSEAVGPRVASFPDTVSREGVWVIGPILPGKYRVGVDWVLSDEIWDTPPVRWRVQWYDHVASAKNATTISVTAGNTTQAGSFNFIPAPNAFISGRVLDASHNPVEGAWVGAESTNGEIAWADEATDAEGHYAVRYLSPGDYTVMADGEQGSIKTTVYGFYPDSATYDGATKVTVDAAQEYGGIDITLTPGQAPEEFWNLTKYQVEVPPMASTTAELLELLHARGVAIESLDDWGVVYVNDDESLSITGLTWKGAQDSMVDVYGYSSAKLLGSFPVRNDSVTAVIPTASLGNGNHHLLIVGRDSGNLRAADFTISDTGLAATGTNSSPLGGLSAALILGGVILLLGAARMRKKGRSAAR